jgi:hypothetical protein
MTHKIAYILAILGILTASAQAQESVPKPTKAEAAKVVKIISNDKAKVATYCKLADLGEEISKASSPRITARLSSSASRPTTWEKPWGQNSSG